MTQLIVLQTTGSAATAGPSGLGAAQEAGNAVNADLAGVLFEQLEYLLAYPAQEQDRLNRVKAILLEAFN